MDYVFGGVVAEDEISFGLFQVTMLLGDPPHIGPNVIPVDVDVLDDHVEVF